MSLMVNRNWQVQVLGNTIEAGSAAAENLFNLVWGAVITDLNILILNDSLTANTDNFRSLAILEIVSQTETEFVVRQFDSWTPGNDMPGEVLTRLLNALELPEERFYWHSGGTFVVEKDVEYAE